MSPAELVQALLQEVVEGNTREYSKMLSTSASTARDPTWKQILTARESMDPAQRGALDVLVKQVVVDTVSTILGILDGPTVLPRFRGPFTLTYESGAKLNGDLQDLFLEATE
jgi:hypothetical protein